MEFVPGQFGAAKYKTNLRPVAVTNSHVPALLDHRSDMLTGFTGGSILIFDRFMGLIFNQRIASDCNDGNFVIHNTTFNSAKLKYWARFKTVFEHLYSCNWGWVASQACKSTSPPSSCQVVSSGSGQLPTAGLSKYIVIGKVSLLIV
jgi:hypothetical protein